MTRDTPDFGPAAVRRFDAREPDHVDSVSLRASGQLTLATDAVIPYLAQFAERVRAETITQH